MVDMIENLFLELLRGESSVTVLGNSNKRGKCGLCGFYDRRLFPYRIGEIDFMICGNCKSIMDMGW